MFDWDAANISHIARHGVSPEEVEEVFANGPFYLGTEIRNREERSAYLGETNAGRILMVVTTERNELIRCVTAYEKREVRSLYMRHKESRDADQN